jgi:hypothetical protein
MTTYVAPTTWRHDGGTGPSTEGTRAVRHLKVVALRRYEVPGAWRYGGSTGALSSDVGG